MAKPSNSEDLSEETPSNGSISSEEEQKIEAEANQEEEDDDEELEDVARTASPDDDEAGGDGDDSTEDDEAVAEANDFEDETVEPSENAAIGKRERARLREMQRLKKQKIEEILAQQNAAIDADMNNKGKGRLKYLLQQTEIFAHFANGIQSASEKKPRGRGRHASKVTEEEEDEEYLKEEEGGFSIGGGTRLVSQPSCKLFLLHEEPVSYESPVDSHACSEVVILPNDE